MSANNIGINRDFENDVLYVFDQRFDRSRTVNIALSGDILLRLDPDTKQIVGLTIEAFSEVMPHFKDYSEYQLMEKFDAVLEFLNAAPMAFEKRV